MEIFKFQGVEYNVPDKDIITTLCDSEYNQGMLCGITSQEELCQDTSCADCIFSQSNYVAFKRYITQLNEDAVHSFGDGL